MFEKLFGNNSFNQKLMTLALPITLQNLFSALVAAADTFMLGSHSQDAMAAVALASQIQFVQNVIVNALMGGLSLMGAQYWGKRDIFVMEKLFGLGISQSTVITLVFTAGCLFVPEQLMRIFASDPALIKIGAQYLRIVSVSFLFFSVSRCYLTVMRVSSHVNCTVWINMMTVLLNVIFNAVFIFGLCGLPPMGVTGAALATLLARFIALAACVVINCRKDFIALRFRTVFAFDKSFYLDFWRYTLPIAGSLMLWSVGFTAYTAIIGHLGKDAAAANAIVAAARNLCCCVCDGLAVGISIMIGHELGSGNLRKGKIYGKRAFILSFLTGGGAAGMILAALPIVSASVSLTPGAQVFLKGMLMVLAVYMIGRSVSSIVINGIFTAGGDTLFNVYSIIIFMWCLALPCAFLGAFYFHWPVVAVFACTCLDEIGKVPFLAGHFLKYKWVKNITR